MMVHLGDFDFLMHFLVQTLNFQVPCNVGIGYEFVTDLFVVGTAPRGILTHRLGNSVGN
jgi:hypothetical protein